MNASRRRDTAGRQKGQIIVLFALVMLAIVAFAGLLVDGGLAWSTRRAGQGAADTAVLRAAQVIVGSAGDFAAAARQIAAANGYPTNFTDCAGNARSDGVVVNRPPASGAFAGNSSYVEVITTRAQHNTFATAIGQSCWLVSARAVAEAKPAVIITNPGAPAVQALIHPGCGSGGTDALKINAADLHIIGNVVSDGGANWTGSGGSINGGALTYYVGPDNSPVCQWAPHGHPADSATGVTSVTGDPFPFTLADLCPGGLTKGSLTLSQTPTIPSGTYCYAGVITVKASKPQTGKVTLVGGTLVFNSPNMQLEPYANGVLGWAQHGESGNAVNFKSSTAVWSGILYAPVGEIHVTASAGSVILGNIWGHTVDLVGSGWTIQGNGGTSTTTTPAVIKLVE